MNLEDYTKEEIIFAIRESRVVIPEDIFEKNILYYRYQNAWKEESKCIDMLIAKTDEITEFMIDVRTKKKKFRTVEEYDKEYECLQKEREKLNQKLNKAYSLRKELENVLYE